MSFTSELKSAVNVTNKQLNLAWKRSVVEAFGQVVAKTPVGNPEIWKVTREYRARGGFGIPPWLSGYVGGSARNSWLVGVKNTGAVGQQPLRITTQAIPDIGGSVLLYSNLPYMERLEDGWSTQAPEGMVKTTVANWPTIVAKYQRSARNA